jgi:hypothetical protein
MKMTILALVASVAVAAAAAGVNQSQWMHDVYAAANLADKSILDITLPGTHDSGTFALQENFSPGQDALLEDIVEIADRFGIDAFPLIKTWATAQNLTFYEQLAFGARFIDLRACWSEPTSVDPTAPLGWHTFHMILGNPIQALLDEIAAFMSATPGGEVLVLEVTHLYGSNASTQAQLQAMLQATLGPWLVKGMPFNSTLETLTANSTQNRVLVLLEDWDGDGSSTGLWPDALIQGQYANKDSVAPMAAWDQGLIDTLGGAGEIFRLWWTLTETADDVVAGILDKSDPQSLFDLAHEANVQLQAWADANRNYTLGNLLVVDHIQETPAVSIAIADALRDCVDDAAYRARSSSGEDCRSWAQDGLCQGQGSKQDMVRAHCKRSCVEC